MRARYSKQRGYVIASRSRSMRPTVRTVQRKIKFGPTAARYLGIMVLCILGIIMLTRSSASSTDAYAQNQLRKDIGQVTQDIGELNLAAQRAKAVQEIQNSAVKEGMTPVTNAEFVEEGNVEKGEVAGASTQR